MILVAGSGGGSPFFPLAAALHEPEPEDRLVAVVETLCTLARELLVAPEFRQPFLPLNAVNADEDVVVVEILLIDGAYERR